MLVFLNLLQKKKLVHCLIEFNFLFKQLFRPQLYEFMQIEFNPEVHIALIPKLPKAQYLKFQPHKTEFIEQTYHPKQILEVELRNYPCLHLGDTIQIQDATKVFKLDVLEIKPDNEYKAAILLDADIDFDLAPPLDYNERNQLQKKNSQVIFGNEEEKQQAQQQQQNSGSFFSGKGVLIDAQQQMKKKTADQQEQKKETKEEYDPRKFKLRHGVKSNAMQQVFEGDKQKIDPQFGQAKKR